MDNVLMNLYLAEAELANYVEISAADEFFESDDPEKAKVIANNAAVTAKAKTGISAAISALIELVKKIISTIGDFITGKSRKDKKNGLDNAEAVLRDNPELAKKMVSVPNNKAYQEALDKAIKEVEDAEKSGADPSSANAILDRLGKVANAGSTQVAADIALKMAKNDISTARMINSALQFDQGVLEKMERDLGQHQAAKFEKKMKDYSKSTFWRRMGIKLRHKKATNAIQEFDNIVNGVLSFVPGTAQNGDKSLKMMKNKAKVAGMVAKNETLRDAAVDGYGAYKDGKKQVKQAERTVKYYKGMAQSGLKAVKTAFKK